MIESRAVCKVQGVGKENINVRFNRFTLQFHCAAGLSGQFLALERHGVEKNQSLMGVLRLGVELQHLMERRRGSTPMIQGANLQFGQAPEGHHLLRVTRRYFEQECLGACCISLLLRRAGTQQPRVAVFGNKFGHLARQLPDFRPAAFGGGVPHLFPQMNWPRFLPSAPGHIPQQPHPNQYAADHCCSVASPARRAC